MIWSSLPRAQAKPGPSTALSHPTDGKASLVLMVRGWITAGKLLASDTMEHHATLAFPCKNCCPHRRLLPVFLSLLIHISRSRQGGTTGCVRASQIRPDCSHTWSLGVWQDNPSRQVQSNSVEFGLRRRVCVCWPV